MPSLPELARVHDRYLSIAGLAREHFQDTLSGKLLLCSGWSTDGVATVVAASIAGAASLYVDADAESLRRALRSGFIDFVVGQLDESLRILKNELRRGRPVSVGLSADPEECIAAVIDRGLQPDLIAAVPQRHVSVFLARGATALPEPTPEASTAILYWSVADDPVASMQSIARIAAGCLDPTRADTRTRRHWLEQSPRYLGRAFGSQQCVRMTEEEAAAFAPRIHAEFPTATITSDGENL